MARYTRFEMPVDPNHMEVGAQALFDAIQAQMRAHELRKRGYTREWTAEEMENLERGELSGGFAGPDRTWPIGSAEDVTAAWALTGEVHAPQEVVAGIRAIAVRCGWGDVLPKGE